MNNVMVVIWIANKLLLQEYSVVFSDTSLWVLL